MLPFGIGFGEILVIGLVLLLVVGPHKLPDLARQFGKGVRAFRRAMSEVRDAMDVEEVREIRRNFYTESRKMWDDVTSDPEAPPRTPPRPAVMTAAGVAPPAAAVAAVAAPVEPVEPVAVEPPAPVAAVPEEEADGPVARGPAIRSDLTAKPEKTDGAPTG
jgi:sec-independent protein translocase protein TatB